MSIAVRNGTCHCPSASIRNPSCRASNSSVTSRTRLTSSRDSINMGLFSLPFLLLNPIDHTRSDVHAGLKQYHINALKRIDDEIQDQAEFVILPFSRFDLEWHSQKTPAIAGQGSGECFNRVL